MPGPPDQDLEILNTELAAWQKHTNADQRQIQWQFTSEDARVRLRHLDPTTKQNQAATGY
jgi:hypothetical protein